MNVVISLSEYSDFMTNTFGLKKNIDFYRNLARKGDLQGAFLSDGGHWLVKVKSNIYQINEIENLIEENIKLKEKLKNIQKIIN